MTARQDPISRWRSQLAESEELLSSGSERFRWVRKIYIRVYRFLLASYGEKGREFAPGDVDERPASSEIPHGHLPHNVAVPRGREPKSARRIRDTLDRVHDANERPTPTGPLAEGLDQDAWIVVASETAHISMVRCKKLLLSEGIRARIVRRGVARLVEVPLRDREVAFELVDQNRSVLRTIARRHRSRLLGATCGFGFGALLFTFLGVNGSLANATPLGPSSILKWTLTGGVLGALAGWIVGVSRIRRV